MKRVNLSLYQSQAQTNVGFTAFMTAVVIFFVGLLITSYDSYDQSIKVPISFLIISTFGFLYATLVFANASDEVSERSGRAFNKHMLLGDVLSEYLGVYLLVLSLPLVINVITSDVYLRIVTISSSLIGLAIYQFSHLSVLERHFKSSKIISVILLSFGLLIFIAQIYDYYLITISTAFVLFLLIITYLASKGQK